MWLICVSVLDWMHVIATLKDSECNDVFWATGSATPLYNTIVGVQANFRVNYPNHVITRVKYTDYIGKEVLSCHWGPALIRVLSKTMLYNKPLYKEFQVYFNISKCKISSYHDCPLLKILRILSLDLPPWWGLGTDPLSCGSHWKIVPIVNNSDWEMTVNEPRHEKTRLREFPTRSDSNWPAQL